MKKISQEVMRNINGGGYICAYCGHEEKWKSDMQKHQIKKHESLVVYFRDGKRRISYDWYYNWCW